MPVKEVSAGGVLGAHPPSSKIRRRSTIGICLQLVTSKFCNFLHDSIITKIPSAGMTVSVDDERSNSDHTGELGRSHSELSQLFTASYERSSLVTNASVVED